MQFKATFAIFVTAVVAQDLSKLPQCAQPCFTDNFRLSGCKYRNDFACLCQSERYNEAVAVCVAKSCEDDDKRKARTLAKKTCKEAGYPI